LGCTHILTLLVSLPLHQWHEACLVDNLAPHRLEEAEGILSAKRLALGRLDHRHRVVEVLREEVDFVLVGQRELDVLQGQSHRTRRDLWRHGEGVARHGACGCFPSGHSSRSPVQWAPAGTDCALEPLQQARTKLKT
jgi:hypothetical protein